jgi:hypothetical protein
MREASFPGRPAATVRFTGRGRSGRVVVRYGVTARPAASGFPALAGWSRVARAGVGFPTIKCEVESDRPGYWAILGWVQWVAQEFGDGRDAVGLVDRVPALLDRDVPFAVLGYAPTFFDAPAFLSRPAVDWRATAFLTTLPTMSRREPVAPLVGFRWGYRIRRDGGRPVPYPLEAASAPDWRRVRGELVRLHPAWRFARSFRPPPRLVRRRGGRRSA